MEVQTFVGFLCTIAMTSGVVTFNTDKGKGNKIPLKPKTPKRYILKPYFQINGTKPARQLNVFTVRNCGAPTQQSAKLVNLMVTPDPIQKPGQVGINIAVDVSKQATSPLQAAVLLEMKTFSNSITIPCVSGFGSCFYDDVCKILGKSFQCPQPFIDLGVPCKCPFPVGNYTLPTTQFEIDSQSALPAGEYFGQLNMTKNGHNVACFQATFTIA